MPRSSALTPQALRDFRIHGYVRVPGYFRRHELAVLRDAADRVARAPGALAVFEADRPDLCCRVEDFLDSCAPLRELVSSRVAPLVSRLFGEPAEVFKEKLNFKHPGGGAFRPHQDYPAFAAFPATYHVTAMLTVDPSDPETGCLRFAHAYREAVDALDAREARLTASGNPMLAQNRAGDVRGDIAERFDWRDEPTSPADLMLFDSFVPHRSEVNRSDERSRRAIFVTFNPRSQGAHRASYYRLKRTDPGNPLFHVGTPTRAGANANTGSNTGGSALVR